MRSEVRAPSHVYGTSSPEEGESELQNVDDYFLTCGGKHSSLMQVPFWSKEMIWEISHTEKVHLQGKAEKGSSRVFCEVDSWKLQVPLEGKPRLLVRKVAGPWMGLKNPKKTYHETIKVVLVAAHFLSIAKQCPDASKGAVWRYVRKECSFFKTKPSVKDLSESFPLLQAVVKCDPELETSFVSAKKTNYLSMCKLINHPCSCYALFFCSNFALLSLSFVVQKFFPVLFKKRAQAPAADKFCVDEDDTGAKVIAEVLEVKTMSDDTSTTHHQAEHGEKEKTIKRKTTETVAGELITSTTKGRAHPSDEGAKRIRRLDSVNLQATNHSLSETSPPSMPRKRPRRKPKRGKKGKQHEDSPSVKSSNGEEEKVEDDTWVPEAEMGMNGNGEDLPSKSKSEERKEEEEEEEDAWVDEPEVCAFCDDGVVEGETLLCCDGLCMRSFHPTKESGMANECPSLDLPKTALLEDGYLCPNCLHQQHQCFSCNKLGSSRNSIGSQEVFVCGAKECRRFYHPQCIAKLLHKQKLQREALAFRIQSGLATFRCPLHRCHKCGLEDDKTVEGMSLVKCRRCPVAWHNKCIPKECQDKLWAVDGGKVVMYCRSSLYPRPLILQMLENRHHTVCLCQNAQVKHCLMMSNAQKKLKKGKVKG
ncbi:hypothetical protein BDL97_19G059000 [Sphagnum fallax]|nr:hypothetical protein BDL97_19G059000 [Sphagnum fallax]